MRKLSLQENLTLYKRNEKKRIIRNALRGAAQPWTLDKAQGTFANIQSHKEKVRIFNQNIGGIFPLILDLVANGWSIRRVERQMMLTDRMLWQWLKVRAVLMREVRAARGLRGGRWYRDEDF